MDVFSMKEGHKFGKPEVECCGLFVLAQNSYGEITPKLLC